MAIRLLVPMDALPERLEELVTTFQTLATEVRQEPGCEEYELYQSTEKPNRLVLLEQWADEASLETHAEQNRKRGLNLSALRSGSGPMERYRTTEAS